MQEDILQAARMLYENIRSDIDNAKDRIEHIRISSLAQEAQNLLTDLENFISASTGSASSVIDSNREEEIN
jgi:hypothetical protein